MGVFKERTVLFNNIYEVDAHICYIEFPELGLFLGRIEKAFFWYNY